MKVRISGKGTTPLLMHNVRLASPINKYAKQLSALTSAKTSSKRTDQDRIDIARVEFEGGMYHNDEVGPYAPGKWFSKNLLDAARRGRRGKLVEEGVLLAEGSLVNPLIYRGPRDVETMWGNGESEFVSFETVRVGQAKIDRCRPIFTDWAFEVDFEIEDDVMDFATLESIAKIGSRLGVGDYRTGSYGRFSVAVSAL
jgi:hypothetical protein